MEGWISSARSTVEAAGQGDEGEPWSLPPGFRFHPTDEELVVFYLANKIHDAKFTHRAITEADLNTCEPWELPGKAQMGETEWYFYSLRDRKYPTGIRTNRATQAGYWKATGKDRAVVSSRSGKLVGMKKTLVFYIGRAPNGLKSNWVMHEYRAAHIMISPATAPPFKSRTTSAQNEWAVCRVFHKTAGGKKVPLADIQQSNARMGLAPAAAAAAALTQVDQTAPITLPALMELPLTTASSLSSSLPSAYLSGHAQPGTIQLANLLHSLPPATNNFTFATPDEKLDNSVVDEALFQNYGSALHDTSFYDKIKPEPVCYSIPTIFSSDNITVDIFSSSCSAARVLELQEAPRFKYASLPLFQVPSPRHINLQGQQGPTIISFNANNAAAVQILSPEALSDSCSTEHASPPHVFPLPSDLEGLHWLYAGHRHQPV